MGVVRFDTDEEPLGQGAFGKIYLGELNDFPEAVNLLVKDASLDDGYLFQVVVKVVTLDTEKANPAVLREIAKTVKKEMKSLQKLQNTDMIVHFHGYGSVPDTREQVLVMEYMQGGDLRHVLDKHGGDSNVVTELARLNWARQASKAVSYIHSMGIIHRDIKAENFLLNSDFTMLKVSTVVLLFVVL